MASGWGGSEAGLEGGCAGRGVGVGVEIGRGAGGGTEAEGAGRSEKSVKEKVDGGKAGFEGWRMEKLDGAAG